MRATLEHGAGALIAGALETLNYGAFVVDGACRIVSITDEAEKMLASGQFVRSRGRRLEAADEKTELICERSVEPGLRHASHNAS